MSNTIVIRIRMDTLRELKKSFPAYKDETMVSYFWRLNQLIKRLT